MAGTGRAIGGHIACTLGPTTLTFVNPTKCVPGTTTYGTIIVQ